MSGLKRIYRINYNMNNTFFQYKSITELFRKYQLIYELLEESEGILDEEIEIKLREIQEDEDELGYDLIQMIDGLEIEKEQNKKRIEHLKKKNNTLDNSVNYLESVLKQIVNKRGIPSEKSGNKQKKFSDRNVTVNRTINYEVEDSFFHKDYVKFEIDGKLNKEHADRIQTFLTQHGEDAIMKRTVLKRELNEYLKNVDELPDGVIQVKKENLIVR